MALKQKTPLTLKDKIWYITKVASSLSYNQG